MRNISKGIFLSTIVLIICSCEDVVQIETADTPKQVVVDAWLNTESEAQEIRLTYSQPYFQADPPAAVTGAQVNVTSSSGETFAFGESEPGVYIWQPLDSQSIGIVGSTFDLNITLDDQEIYSTSTVYPVPVIDSIRQEYRENELTGPDGIYTDFIARDFPGLGNTYWIKTFKNGKFLNKPEEINLAYDAGFDGGSEIDGIIFITPIRELTNRIPDESETDDPPYIPGDQIRIEIHSISIDAFEFMSSVRDEILNGTNTIFASPIANSPGNVFSSKADTEVLGIFCVSAVSRLEAVIQ